MGSFDRSNIITTLSHNLGFYITKFHPVFFPGILDTNNYEMIFFCPGLGSFMMQAKSLPSPKGSD